MESTNTFNVRNRVYPKACIMHYGGQLGDMLTLNLDHYESSPILFNKVITQLAENPETAYETVFSLHINREREIDIIYNLELHHKELTEMISCVTPDITFTRTRTEPVYAKDRQVTVAPQMVYQFLMHLEDLAASMRIEWSDKVFLDWILMHHGLLMLEENVSPLSTNVAIYPKDADIRYKENIYYDNVNLEMANLSNIQDRLHSFKLQDSFHKDTKVSYIHSYQNAIPPKIYRESLQVLEDDSIMYQLERTHKLMRICLEQTGDFPVHLWERIKQRYYELILQNGYTRLQLETLNYPAPVSFW